MKKSLLLFGLSLCFSLSLFAQHSIQLETGFTKGANNPGKSFSLSWFAVEGLLSGGALRLNYMNATEEVDYHWLKNQEDILQIDVIKRWHSDLDKRVTLFLEVGLSGMVLDSEVLYGVYDCLCLGCECAFPISEPFFPSQEEGMGISYTYKDRDHQLSFLPGSTIGTGVDVNLTKRFFVGLHYRGNAYYQYGSKDVIYYVTTALSAGFRF